MEKETQKIAEELLRQGKQVLINEKGELFTQENLAKASGSPYQVYRNSKIQAGETKPNYVQENNETLLKLIEERGLELGDAKVKKDFVAILEADDLTTSN